MNAGALQFHILPNTLLNFTKTVRSLRIIPADIIVAYAQVSFTVSNEKSELADLMKRTSETKIQIRRRKHCTKV